MAQKFTFGKNAVIRIAAITAAMVDQTGNITKPDASAFVDFCLPKEVTMGSEAGTTDIESFCTGGQTISVRDGSTKGTLSLGEVLWVRGDPSLGIVKAAYDAEDEAATQIYVEVLPEGVGAGKLTFDFIVQVNKWEMKIPAKGLITATYDLSVLEGPTETVQTAGAGAAPTPLASGVAVPNLAGAQGSVKTYSIAVGANGTLAVTTNGGTGNVDLRVKTPAGAQAGISQNADNSEAVNLTALAAGTYTVELLGAAAYDGVTLTATVS